MTLRITANTARTARSVALLVVQTNNPNRELDRDFGNAVMQAMVE